LGDDALDFAALLLELVAVTAHHAPEGVTPQHLIILIAGAWIYPL